MLAGTSDAHSDAAARQRSSADPSGPTEPTDPTGLVPIEGTLYDGAGQTLAGARVVARAEGIAAPVECVTTAEGAFRMLVWPGPYYDVAATRDGFGAAADLGVLAPARIALVLTAGAAIRGRVVDREGNGVAGVLLRYADNDSMVRGRGELGLPETTSGADGAYKLEHVPTQRLGGGTAGVEVAGGPVRVGAVIPVRIPGSGEVACDIEVEPCAPVAVDGAVVDDAGLAIAGAQVRFRPGGAARTDGWGKFRIDRLQPGLLWAEVSAPGRPARTREVFVSDPPEPLEIRLGGRDVRGRVVDAEGRPVSGASVRWIGPTSAARSHATAEDGVFVLPDIPADEDGTVRVDADGFAAAQVGALAADPEIVVRLFPSASVEGRVLGGDGEPCAGVLVRLLPSASFGSEGLRGLAVPQGLAAHHGRATRTDTEGRYYFGDLGRGTAIVVAAAEIPGLLAGRVEIAITAGMALTAPTIRLRDAAGREGKVLDAEGRPLPGALVRFTSLLGSSVTVAGAEGRFDVPAAIGLAERIVVTHPLHGAASLPLDPEERGPLRISVGGTGQPGR